MSQWYPQLTKPGFTPPSWVFAPVWTTLYLLMAVAAWLLWRRRARPGAKAALTLFLVQLVLNALWSGLFFGLRNPLAGLIDLAALWLALSATIVLFARVRVLAAGLLIPYWAWVTFAGALNAQIWRLNA
jgi:tryptophan-rich sensory protein